MRNIAHILKIIFLCLCNCIGQGELCVSFCVRGDGPAHIVRCCKCLELQWCMETGRWYMLVVVGVDVYIGVCNLITFDSININAFFIHSDLSTTSIFTCHHTYAVVSVYAHVHYHLH